MRDYIEIKKELIPYRFNILLADEWFAIFVDYNKTADMYTISLYKDDELIATEPLIINSVLFKDVYQPSKFPSINLVPYDPSGNASNVSQGNLEETVFLSIDDESGDKDD